MAEMFFDRPVSQAMGAGLRVPSARFGDDPATRMGVGNLQPTDADTLVSGREAPRQAPSALDTLNAVREARGARAASLFEGPTLGTPAGAPVRPPAMAYFNQATNEMFVGDRAFKADDIRSALEASQAPGNTQRPTGAGWVALPETAFGQYLSSFSERRSTGELLGRGLKNIAYGLGTLPGTAATLAGFEETGAALRAPVESFLGDSENEQLRSALIAENSSLWEQIVDGSIESIPLLLASLAGGAGAAAWASRAGKAASTVTRAGTAGAAGVNFPIHLAGMYDAAVRNQQDLNDPLVKIGVLGGALANSYLDTFGIESRLLSPVVKAAAENAAKSTVRRRLTSGIATGFTEAGTEVAQTFLESVLFDPVVHDNLSPQDWKVLAPYIAERYGEQMLVAAGAGALLGGGVGVALPQGAFARGPKPPVPTDKPIDLNTTATEQAAEKEAPTAAAPELYGQQSFQPLALPYIPGAETIGAVPVAPTGPEQVADINRPMTLQQVGLMRGATGGLRPDERQAGNVVVPGGDRNITLEGEVLPPTPAARLRRGLPGPAPAAALPPPGAAAADFTAGPEGVAPTGAPAPRPGSYEAAVAAGLPPVPERLRVTGQTTDTAMGNQLRAAMAAREAAAAQQAAEQRAAAEAARQAQLAEGARAAEVEAAYAQRAAQVEPARMDRALALQEAYVDAEVAWESFRPEQSGVTLRDLTPAAQRDWMAATQQGTADQALYQQLRKRRRVGKAAPIIDVPDVMQPETAPAPAPKAKAKAPPKPKPLPKKQRDVIERFGGLTPEQQQAVLADLGTDAQGLGTLIASNPDAVNAAIDRVVAPPPPPPAPTRPTGQATIQRQGAAKAAAPKAATVQRGAAAQPKPRAEAVPEGPGVPTQAKPRAEPSSIFTEVTTAPTRPSAFAALADKGTTRTGGRAATAAANVEAVLDKFTAGGTYRTPRQKREAIAARREAERTAPTAAQTREAVTVDQAIARAKDEAGAQAVSDAELLDAELDGYIEELADPELAADERDQALFGVMAIAEGRTPKGLRDTDPELAATYRARLRRAKEYVATLSSTDQTYAKELWDKYKSVGSVPEMQAAGEALEAQVGGPTAVHTLNAMLDVFTASRASNADLPPGFMKAFRETAVAVKALGEEGRAALRGNVPLLAYVNAQNEPNVQRGELTARGSFSLANWNTIEGVVDLDGKPVTAIAPGRVQLLVRNFLGKLARAPKVTVVRNQADLRTKFPQLYARAVAARPQGDFDTAQAMGYSFGDGQVIVFTDRIATEQQLNFVLAHESMGHYGLRAIMPGPKFDALMEAVYNLDERVARAADAAMAVRPNLSKAEAVEEYLSDYAAILDTSLVARVWNAIKSILNKLGVRTGDEMTRYLLDQSRRYVRYGTGVTLDAGSVGQRLHSVETSGDTGRFSTGKSLRDVNIEVGLMRDTLGATPQSFGEAWDYIKARNINTIDALDRFKAQVLSLANYRARINPGAAAFEDSLKQARDISMSLKTKYNEMMRVALSRAVYGELGGISTAQRSTVSKMLMAGLRRGASDYAKAGGDLGRVPLFRIDGNKLIRNTPEIERLQKNGTRTFEDMRDGFDYEVEFEEGGKTVKKKERFEGIKGLTKTSIEWRSYESVRKAMDGIELELLEAHYRSLIDNRDLMFRKLAQSVTDGELNADERAALVTVAETYSNLYTTDVTVSESGGAKLDPDYQTYANDVLRMTNMALIGESTDRFDALRKLLVEPRVFLKGEADSEVDRTLPPAMEAQAADDLIAKLKGFRQRLSLKGDKFAVQDKVKQIITAEIANQDADAYTKRTLFTGYVPILREGRFQMRVVALVDGKPVQVKDSYREQLVYSQFDSLSEAVEMAGKANEAFGNTPFEVMYYSDAAQGYVLGNVTLQAVPETALETVAAPPDINLNEFLRGIRQFDINLSPQKLEQLVVALTRQNSSARNRLMRAFTPGADPDAIMAASRHIESRASTVAKVATRVRRSELMDRSMRSTNELWNAELKDPNTGRDWAEVLKERADAMDADPTASREAKVDARRMYEAYAHMVKQTRGGPANRANQFYGEAAKTMAFVEGNKNLDESDFGAKPWVSGLRATTSMVQLGGSIATGAMNFVALETNVVPYLASYNSKTAFGGGFGLGNVHREMIRAATQVGGRSIVDSRFDTAEFFAEVEASDALQKQFGLSAREAQFLKEGILDGKLTPAQTNALIGTSRGRVTRGATQKFIDGWMWTFNAFERASRQTAGLAAYRLEYARKIAAGKPEAEAHDQATQFALQALDLTLGDYAVLNRPPAWRSGLQSFAYMYKVFITTSVQLLANMDRKGQIFMLGALWMLTGLAGLPFAEDLEDVIDAIAQTLKIPGWQGARYEAAQLLDSAFPGMSPMLMQGLVNQFVPGDVAAKTSLGDLLPGTGALVAGGDPWRSAMEILGPAAGMVGASITFSKQALTAPFTATVDVEDVLRESPITMMRAAGEAYVYTQNGAVVDRRGYTVSPDMNAMTVLARVLGFYPVAASRQYEMIGMAKRITDYQREQAAAYRIGWIKATMEGDRARAREIEREVDAWNAGSKGTGLEIRNFVKNSQRALQEARRPASARTLRSAPNAAERDLQNLIDLMIQN